MNIPVAELEMPTLNFDNFMRMVMQGFRNRVVADIAEAYTEPCQKCGGKHYHGAGAVVPCRDDDTPADPSDRSGDHTHEVVWLCCMTCGQVYDTFNMEISPDMVITGKPDITDGDAEFISHIQEAVAFSFSGTKH